MGLQAPVPTSVQACAGNTDEVEQIRTHTSNCPQRCSLLLVSKMCRSILSNVNLTPCVYHTSCKSIILRLIPSNGWRKRVEQLSLGFQLYIREPEARTPEIVDECGAAGVVRPLTNWRGEDGSRPTSGERRDRTRMRMLVNQQGPWCFVLQS